MPKVAVYNMEGKQVGELELNDAIFGVKVNEDLMHKVGGQSIGKPSAGYCSGEESFRGKGRWPQTLASKRHR